MHSKRRRISKIQYCLPNALTYSDIQFQVSSKYESLLNFGPYVPDGYGVCYNPMPYKILFSVSAWNKDVENFAESFMESLNDAYALLLK